MSLAIKFGNFLSSNPSTTGFIYLDAVSQYTRDFKGQLTSHPIGSGSIISDHFIRSNPEYRVTGVISGADISLGRYLIADFEKNSPSNVNNDIEAVKIKSGNALLSLIPESITSYFVNSEDSVNVASHNRKQTLANIRLVLEKLFENSEVLIVKLFEYQDTKVVRLIDNLVCSSMTFTEDAESGFALYLSMSFEQATFTNLKVGKLTSKDRKELDANKVDGSIADAAAPKANLGTAPAPPDLLKRPDKTDGDEALSKASLLAKAFDAASKPL